MTQIVERRGVNKTYGPACPQDPIEATNRFFKVRLCKGGAWVAARLWSIEERDTETGDLLRDVQYRAEINGEPTDPFDPFRWPWTETTAEDFQFLMDDAAWCRENKPSAPAANPWIPANLAPEEFF